MKYIITANFGNYENYIPDYYHKGWKHIYFTDNPDTKIPNWEVVVLDNYDKINRHIKSCPHHFLPDITESWWVDSNIRLNTLTPTSAEWMTMQHPHRNDVLGELQACITMKKDDREIMQKQIDGYRADGFDFKGMVASGIVYRRHTDKVKKVGEDWWHEVLTKSRRDQLSFNYVCWKNNFKYETMPFMHGADRFVHRKQNNIKVIETDNFIGDILTNMGVEYRKVIEEDIDNLTYDDCVICLDQPISVFDKLRQNNLLHACVLTGDSNERLYKRMARFIPNLMIDDLRKAIK